MPILRLVMKVLFSLLFILAGLNHFRIPDFYASIIPDYLPWHLELVYVSGICEVLLGVLLLVPPTSQLAAWGLIALLLAVFPANIHMAVVPEQFPRFSPWMIYARLPLQAVFLAWAYWFTRPSDDKATK